jgi:2-keto-4-pentenoate hydratase/2-oxohepta-3-ene-1,7-dioic acid hydratase in catechol pathway
MRISPPSPNGHSAATSAGTAIGSWRPAASAGIRQLTATFSTTRIMFANGSNQAEELLRAAVSSRDRHTGTPRALAKLLAPVPRPGAIYCAGANYSDHVAEMR